MARLMIRTKPAHSKAIEYLLRQKNIRAHLAGQGYRLTPSGFVQAMFDKAIVECESSAKSSLAAERLKKIEANPKLAAQIDSLKVSVPLKG